MRSKETTIDVWLKWGYVRDKGHRDGIYGPSCDSMSCGHPMSTYVIKLISPQISMQLGYEIGYHTATSGSFARLTSALYLTLVLSRMCHTHAREPYSH